MRAIIDPSKQKFVIILVAALTTFFGLEVASQTLATYQLPLFLRVSLYVYLFLIFWQTFVFDLHLKKAGSWRALEHSLWQALKARFEYLKERHHWLHFQNYLILPGFIYWMTVALLFLNPFDELRKQVWIFLSTVALSGGFWYLKTVFYSHREASRISREVIFLAKLYASYLSFAAGLGLVRYFGLGAEFFTLTAFLITFWLLFQALFQHHFIGFQTLKFLLLAGIGMAAAGYFVYSLWNVNFYSGGLVLAAVYNTIWGLVHHKFIDQNLTRRIVYEYLAVLFVILVIVFGTTNFAERI